MPIEPTFNRRAVAWTGVTAPRSGCFGLPKTISYVWQQDQNPDLHGYQATGGRPENSGSLIEGRNRRIDIASACVPIKFGCKKASQTS